MDTVKIGAVIKLKRNSLNTRRCMNGFKKMNPKFG